MATGASDARMLPCQREARELVVKQDPLFPTVHIVAAAAISAQMPAMRIVVSMAANAGGRRHGYVSGLLVTCLALDSLVGTCEWESRHAVVIEAGDLPVTTVVAFCTICPISALVTVILLVTAIAAAWWLFDAVARPMASRASSCRMAAQQRKACVLVVIEGDCLPGTGRVATCAVGASRSLMHVILGVTANAGAGRRPDSVVDAVTTSTSNRSVTTQEWKSRIARMVERCRAPR